MKNKKYLIILIISLIIIFAIATFIYLYNNNNQNNNSYQADKTSTNTFNDSLDADANNAAEESEDQKNTVEEDKKYGITSSPIEEPLSEFTTKIYSTDSARQNNINITCNTLNGTVVNNRETFSFCNTVGKATTDKGYQEADIYDHDGKKEKGLGGGNCQVSSTLYNAVLKVNSLKVTERHAHSNKVPYVEKGKDAAVAYGSYDLKFVNNTGYSIKIYASTDGTTVTTKLVTLK